LSPCLQEIVRFRSDRLFHGAVNIDWFLEDEGRREAAASSFVFHGPEYHGVSQSEVDRAHGHLLKDTATFAVDVLRVCSGQEDRPFTLAIAGYGTGKSHLALSLAALLSAPESGTAAAVLTAIEEADKGIASEVRVTLREMEGPCLVVALNGMRSFDLSAEVARQVMHQLESRGLETRALDELQLRFAQAASLVQVSGDEVVRELLDHCGAEAVDDLLNGLRERHEQVYSDVHDFFAERGVPIRALGGESVRDVIDVACQHYCGDGRPFAKLVVLFDEFGRYTEFATVKSHIAGPGALQALFEAVQANSDRACFFGFIQFELNAYVQRVAAEHRNEILRYVTRYQAADKAHLSINLETLIAALIEKRRPDLLDAWFDRPEARAESEALVGKLRAWYPQSENYQLWTDPDRLHTVIRKGCWPLSTFAVWLVFYLTAAGKFLQERSALTLLDEILGRNQETPVAGSKVWALAPADLWSEGLQQELMASEEAGQQGSITHGYTAVLNQHGNRLGNDLTKTLKAVVLGSKLGLRVESRDEAIEALSELAGVPAYETERSVSELQHEYNVLEWDEGFKQFDILGDAVPRTQFLSFLRQRVSSSFDEDAKARLFASKGRTRCALLGDLESDFAEHNSITTREWRYRGATSDLSNLTTHLHLACQRWRDAVAVDEPRGTVVYCYVGPKSDPDQVAAEAGKLIRVAAKEVGAKMVPVLVVLLCDEDGRLGQAMAELEILDEALTKDERSRFGNMVAAQAEKSQQVVNSAVEAGIKERRYICCFRKDLVAKRIGRAGAEIFGRIYTKPVPFPFDGFSTARGNAADSCQQLISDLLAENLDFNSLISKPPKIKNRGVRVLKKEWGIFTATGSVTRRPRHTVIKTVMRQWDKELEQETGHLDLACALQELCRAPYGANIASAGLLLGVFVAARSAKLGVVVKGEQLALAQWLDRGIFKGKFLDLGRLNGVELVPLGGASTEWEELLDEWDASSSCREQLGCLERYHELKTRLPVPSDLLYRAERLQERAAAAATTFNEVENSQDHALRLIEKGTERGDVETLSSGSAQLEKIIERMQDDPLWTDQQVARLRPFAEEGRQKLIELFPRWLRKQAPASDSPAAVGEFTQRMKKRAGANLKRLRLDAQYDMLDKHTRRMAREAETAASARQLLRDISSWIDQHAEALRVVRLAQLRGLESVGQDYRAKLLKTAKKIELDEFGAVRERLADFMDEVARAKKTVTDRALQLWETELGDCDSLEALRQEVEALVPMFEGCSNDLEDLQMMRRALVSYGEVWTHLGNLVLTNRELEEQAKELGKTLENQLGGGELPWPVNETLECILQDVRRVRKEESSQWTAALAVAITSIDDLTTAELTRLHDQAQTPPAFLEGPDKARVAGFARTVEDHLNSLAMEWLLERFRQLPDSLKQEFLRMASGIAGEVE